MTGPCSFADLSAYRYPSVLGSSRVLGLTCFVALLALTACSVGPQLIEAGPDWGNGTLRGRPSSAGIVTAIAGSQELLFAIAPTSGVWRIEHGTRWQQLAASPRYAHSIAVDPSNPQHVIVGERTGAASPALLQRTGLWESTNGGLGWVLRFNARSSAACVSAGSTVIRAVAFSPTGSLFASTPCGVFRRRPGPDPYAFNEVTGVSDFYTALAMSESPTGTRRVWARTANALFMSANDGDSWSRFPIPPTASDATGRLYQVNANEFVAGDAFSLAVDDTVAYIAFIAPNASALGIGNKNTLLTFDLTTQVWRAHLLDSGNGTGLGGRRLLKSFVTRSASGQARTWVIFSPAQELYSVGRLPSGDLVLGTLGYTTGADVDPAKAHIHADIWDVHVPPTFSGWSDAFWVACDGGVYKRDVGLVSIWREHVAGLHTHNVEQHGSTLFHPQRRPALFYATADNDEWEQAPTPLSAALAPWRIASSWGDSQGAYGDRWNARLGLLVRDGKGLTITGFGSGVADAQLGMFGDWYCDRQPGGGCNGFRPQALQVIQTPEGEEPPFWLDVVLLIANPATTFPSVSNPGGGPVLLRNGQFAKAPQLVTGNTAWRVERNDLPAFTRRIWVSGGHASPTYYAYEEGKTSGPAIYRAKPGGPWLVVNTGRLLASWGGENGPLYLNPYDPTKFYLVTAEGVKRSRGEIGGVLQIEPELALTQLARGSGMYPITGDFSGGPGVSLPRMLTARSRSFGTLSQVSFDPRGGPGVLAASAFAGAFYAADGRNWRSLTPALPHPLPHVSDVSIDLEGVTVSTEGRGLLRVTNHTSARLATFFRLGTDGRMASLHAVELPLIGRSVGVEVTTREGKTLFAQQSMTDQLGRLVFPGVALAEGSQVVVHLHYGGEETYAPSQTSFLYRVPDPAPAVLSVAKNGSGQVQGPGIDCGTVCTAKYPFGTTVTLAPQPDPGWIFSSWSGACSGNGTCSLVLNDNAQVTASFTPEPMNRRTLTARLVDDPTCSSAHGIVQSAPAGLLCQMTSGSATSCPATFDPDLTVTLVASPGVNTVFIGYTGACSGKTCALVMDSDKLVTATFCGLIP